MNVHPPWCSEAPADGGQAVLPTDVSGNKPTPGAAAASSTVPAPVAKTNVNVFKVDEQTTFEVPENLHFKRCLGRGTYGAVCAFRDANLGIDVAIKKIPNPFRNGIDGKRCLREIKLLRLLDHENIIKLLDVLQPSSPDFNEVYIVTELMDADLHTVICSEQKLSDDHVQFFIYQILLALLYMHSANVVHRDLKPLNVLVNKNCDVKLCDFGLARGRAGFSQEDDDFLRTEYVGTRWYRAPEIVLTSMEYTAAVDVWSAGCILGELIGGVPMFRGTDFLDQIRSIVQVLGTPSDADLSFIPANNEAARNFIKCRFPSFERTPWSTLFPDASESQHDLLDMLLKFDPNHRIDILGALRHEYLVEQHSEEDEPAPMAHIDWTFDDVPCNDPLRLQMLIYQEIGTFHPEILDRDQDELLKRGWSTPAPAAVAAAPATGEGYGVGSAVVARAA